MRVVLAVASSDSSSPESQWVLGRVIIKCRLSAAASGFLRGELTELPGCPASCLSAVTALLVSICPFIWNGSSLINKGKSNPQPWHMASVARLEWLMYCPPGGSKPARACLLFHSHFGYTFWCLLFDGSENVWHSISSGFNSIYVEWIQILLNRRTWFLRFLGGGLFGIQKWTVIFFLGLFWELN